MECKTIDYIPDYRQLDNMIELLGGMRSDIETIAEHEGIEIQSAEYEVNAISPMCRGLSVMSGEIKNLAVAIKAIREKMEMREA